MEGAMNFLEILKSVLQGIVQGITEWLPISSTGHMLLLDEFLHMTVSGDPLRNKAFFDLFKVVIQFGSILAVVVLYFHKLNPFSRKKSPLEGYLVAVGKGAHCEHSGGRGRDSVRRPH